MSPKENLRKLLKKRIREKRPKELSEMKLLCKRRVDKLSNQNMLDTYREVHEQAASFVW